MLPESIRALILDEQARQEGGFIEGANLDDYLEKLGDRAEIVSDWISGRCRGFAAFYCNDAATKQAFLSLILVDRRDRGLGIGRALVACVLDLARRRGFTSCRLEVAAGNAPAHALYRSLGFTVVETRTDRQRLEIRL